jgi:hypothetical protein
MTESVIIRKEAALHTRNTGLCLKKKEDVAFFVEGAMARDAASREVACLDLASIFAAVATNDSLCFTVASLPLIPPTHNGKGNARGSAAAPWPCMATAASVDLCTPSRGQQIPHSISRLLTPLPFHSFP